MKEVNPQVRILYGGDLAGYLSLLSRARHDPNFGMGDVWESSQHLESLARSLDPSSSGFHVGAFSGDELVGMAGFGMTVGSEHGTLYGMFVADASRRSGIGTRLLTLLIKNAQARGVVSIKLHVLRTNEAAIALYRRQGFVGRKYRTDATELQFMLQL